MSEIWKPVLGWEEFYHVSNLGRIKSLVRESGRGRHKKELIMRPGPSRGGYLVLPLQANGRRQTVRMNRIVLEAFTGIKHKDPRAVHAAHKNGIRDDNRLENLYWATYAENLADKMRHGNIPKGEQSKRSKLTEKQVREIYRAVHTERIHVVTLAKKYGVNRITIEYIRDRKTWKHLWLTRPDQKYTEPKE